MNQTRPVSLDAGRAVLLHLGELRNPAQFFVQIFTIPLTLLTFCAILLLNCIFTIESGDLYGKATFNRCHCL